MVHIEILGAVGVVVTISSINETDVSAAAQCSLERTEVDTSCTVVVKADNINVVSATHRLRANSSAHSDSLTVTNCPIACTRSRNTVDSRPRVVIQRSKNKLSFDRNSFACRCGIVRTSRTTHCDGGFTVRLIHMRNSSRSPTTRNCCHTCFIRRNTQSTIVVAANGKCISKRTQVKRNARLTYSQRTSCLTDRPCNTLGSSCSIRPTIVCFGRKRSRVTACVRTGSCAAECHISRVVIAPTWRLRRLIVGQCAALGGHVRNRNAVGSTSSPLSRRGVDTAVSCLREESNIILRSIRQTGNRQRRAGILVACRDF